MMDNKNVRTEKCINCLDEHYKVPFTMHYDLKGKHEICNVKTIVTKGQSRATKYA